MRTDRHRPALLLLLGTLLPAAELPAQGSGRGIGVGLRIGAGGGGSLCRVAVVPGVEVRTGGSPYAVAVLDTYLFRQTDRDPCEPRRTPAGAEEVTRVPLSPPRMRAGVGWAGAAGGLRADARAYLGQQGVMDGWQPLAGAGLGLGRGGWGVELDGTLHRADVYARPPGEPWTVVPVRREWVPTVDVAARFDAGTLDGARGVGGPVLGGILGGAAGGAVGFLAGLTANRGCQGDEICLLPALAGAVVGETLGLPLGVHLAEGGRGSYPLGALASAGVTAAGLGAMSVLGDSGATGQGISVLVPVLQLWASIAVERRTAR